MSMTQNEILRAALDGKPVQRLSHSDKWETADRQSILFGWLASDSGRASWPADKYRLKPVPVPPGDLTFEEAVELSRPGVELQYYDTIDEEWNDCDTDPNCRKRDIAYRRKPTPRMVPLGPEDVPPGSVFRLNGKIGWQGLVAVTKGGVWSCSDAMVIKMATWEAIQKHGNEISRDGGKTWAKCEKEAAS